MQSGDVIVVRNDKDATFKKLVIESDGSRYLQAINPNFHPTSYLLMRIVILLDK